MKLYSFLHSPNPTKVRFALAEMGVPADVEEIRLFDGEAQTEAFLRLNPHGKVPVLVDGDLALPESNAILTYLGKKYGKDKWAADETEDALALRWMFFEAVHLAPQCGTIWWNDVMAPQIGASGYSDDVVSEAVTSVARSLDVLEGFLVERTFMLGEPPRFTLVDCSLATTLTMLRGSRIELSERWQRTAAYRERVRGRPMWREVCGDGFLDLSVRP